MIRPIVVALVAGLPLGLPGVASGQSKQYALESTQGLRLHNLVVEPATFKGKKGVRVTEDANAARVGDDLPRIASIDGTAFSSGVIEVEVAGAPAPGAFAGARGFVGIAFRLQPDEKTFDAFFLRPTNGRAEDQERRNHATQYISHPDWTWSRLRRETPSKYEAYVDLEPDTWTKIRIEVRGDRARLFVHDQPQATLVVNDVKSGADRTGGVGLWIGPGTVAHFRNLTVTTESAKRE